MAVDPVIIGSVAALAVLVLFSAMFSATETAFTSLNRIKLRKLAEEGDRRAAKANSRGRWWGSSPRTWCATAFPCRRRGGAFCRT